ncbi:MAG: 4'-phosphopantetheinyl transferase superfamily protein [Chloroflexi bacterium]|nr:4'-phosphopantetheinyl transferase superfamily protein [Chloroflexota bacterium]
MINWLFLHDANDQFQEVVEKPERVFDATELDAYRKILVPKRKIEWLVSRMVCKQVVASSFDSTKKVSPQFIVLRKLPSGVPYVEIEGSGRVGWLSLSHSNDGVFVAFSQKEECHFGIDLEFIEERSPQLITDFFTEGESQWVNSSQGQERIFLANLIWSAKEAFLKAIEKGLQMDTRCVEITSFDSTFIGLDWNALKFQVDKQNSKTWRLFYRQEAGYVLTMCVPNDRQLKLSRMSSCQGS